MLDIQALNMFSEWPYWQNVEVTPSVYSVCFQLNQGNSISETLNISHVFTPCRTKCIKLYIQAGGCRNYGKKGDFLNQFPTSTYIHQISFVNLFDCSIFHSHLINSYLLWACILTCTYAQSGWNENACKHNLLLYAAHPTTHTNNAVLAYHPGLI